MAALPAVAGAVARDTAGTVLAVIVLVTLCVAAGYTLVVFLRPRPAEPDDDDGPLQPPVWQIGIVPLLALAGVGVAGYLSYGELTNTAVACVAGGGCDTVQQSAYSHLFGVIPMGFFGMAGYVLILAAWGVSRYRAARLAEWGVLAGLVMALFGTLFSIYLTSIELFVLRATCIWCLGSAELMTALLCLAAGPGRQAFAELFNV
jgi:uncharacterized membrane protein